MTPLALCTVEGVSGTYLKARCHRRQEVRSFNTAHLTFAPLRSPEFFNTPSSSNEKEASPHPAL